jgi:hypothetical protein
MESAENSTVGHTSVSVDYLASSRHVPGYHLAVSLEGEALRLKAKYPSLLEQSIVVGFHPRPGMDVFALVAIWEGNIHLIEVCPDMREALKIREELHAGNQVGGDINTPSGSFNAYFNRRCEDVEILDLTLS